LSVAVYLAVNYIRIGSCNQQLPNILSSIPVTYIALGGFATFLRSAGTNPYGRYKKHCQYDKRPFHCLIFKVNEICLLKVKRSAGNPKEADQGKRGEIFRIGYE
jgi:hypothetical protein